MTAILECGPNGARHDAIYVGRGVYKVVIFTATLSNQAREVVVVVDVLADRAPDPVEGAVN